MWSVPNQLLRSANSECPPQTNSSQSDFTGRIDRRLSFVYISLFVLLLIVGGASLYLLGSHLIKSAAISRQSEQIHIVEQIDRHLQTFTSAIQLAHLQGNTITNHYLEDSSRQFETLLTRYRNSGGSERNILEMRQMISDAESVTAAIANRMRNNLNPTPPVNTHDLTVMESIQQRIQSFTERVSAEHERVEDELVSGTRAKMRLIIGFNIALVLIGTVFLVVLKRHFNHTIAIPLRRLADKSAVIARGEFPEAIPVASKDEIGLVSHSFNHMAERLREHQEKLKGVAILEERERVACELHDSLAQDLAAIRLKLIAAHRSINTDAVEPTEGRLKELIQIVDDAYQNLRESIFGLRALTLRNDVGLITALRAFLRDFSEVRKLPVELIVADSAAIHFSPGVEIQFIRILHEALANIVKHAHASKGTISITPHEQTATITIEDDGEGFCPATIFESSLRFGLTTMKDRAQSAGGDLCVESNPGIGTKVTIYLPLLYPKENETHSATVG
jgi:nitrate/nitrite-specific signal transduction histidine kinase